MARIALLTYIAGGLVGSLGHPMNTHWARPWFWAGFTILAAGLFIYHKIKSHNA